jgi:lipid-A-disaccharide synthase-like uncharacterized protein
MPVLFNILSLIGISADRIYFILLMDNIIIGEASGASACTRTTFSCYSQRRRKIGKLSVSGLGVTYAVQTCE